MFISHQEDHLVDPKANHPRTLKGDESRYGPCFLIVDSQTYPDCDCKDSWTDKCDKGQGLLACSITCLIVIDLISTWALRQTLTFMKVEARNAAETCVCCTFACIAGLKT